VRHVEDRLDPVRRLSLPTGGTLLRTVAVAALLGLAVLLVYTEPASLPAAPCPPPTAAPSRLPVPAGLVGVAVGLADPAALGVLRAGDRVDLYPAGGTGPAFARNALVLEAIGADPAPVLYLALAEAEALRVASADPGTQFRVFVRAS
jgi:hypothetical protein